MSNPYAPPLAAVADIVDPRAVTVHADRGTRLGAAILDVIIGMCMIYLPLLAGMGIAAVATNPGDGHGDTIFLVAGLLALVGFAVWSWLTIKYINANGQSIGKKFAGIKIVRSDGSAASLGRIFWLRNAVNVALGMVPLYSIVEVLFIFGESRQCLHDKIADTIVIKA